MFVRKIRNRSGSVSVQVVYKDKATRRNKVIKHFGSSSNVAEVERLCAIARQWTDEHNKGLDLFENDGVEYIRNAADYDAVFGGIHQEQLCLMGPELIYGTLFDRMGFGAVRTSDNELFKSLVVTRLYRPKSKLRTSEYMMRFMHKEYSGSRIYRYLDELCWREESDTGARRDVKAQIEGITFNHTKEVVGGEVAVVFYDTTTIYFESREDTMRTPGWSKDGKHSNPQVVLGLLVGAGGNPIGYELHPGNTYEGHTMIPLIKKMQSRFHIGKPVVIADAGLLNNTNIRDLENEGYKYILGARIRSRSADFQKQLASLGLKNGESVSLPVGSGQRMVVTMSDARATKDDSDRRRGIMRLEKRFRSGTLTKDSVNNRGYNKFLTMKGDVTIKIDYSRIEEDRKLDGLKGYITNLDEQSTSNNVIVDNYTHLSMIERAFRMNKTDLDIRPVYHRLFNRIEAHVCICFTAYTIMLELERTLKAAKSSITLDRARFLAERIYSLNYVNPYNKQHKSVLLRTENDPETHELLKLLGKI
mgnify:CR=1 FL=1